MLDSLDELVVDGKVKAAASMFPVQVDIESVGYSTCRFILARGDEDWYALAWKLSSMGQPELIVFEHVESISKFSTARIAVRTSRGAITVTPSSGGCCGNRLRTFNPFGASVQLTRVPVPS